jgi:phosphate:Na+ symporter
LAHTLSKVIGVAVVFPFISQVAGLVGALGRVWGNLFTGLELTAAGKIALLHIMFNIALVIVFLPTLNLMVWVVQKLIPQPTEPEEGFKPLYLDKSALETPSLAFAQVKREVMRIAEMGSSMFERCFRMFSRGLDSEEEIEQIQMDDDKIDILETAVRFYLAEIAQENCSADQVQMQMSLLSITADLEDVGDTISREMVMLAKKKVRRHRMFSDAGWSDLRGFQKIVGKNFELVITMLAQPSEEAYRTLMRHEDHMNTMEQEFRQAHLHRLQQGLQESFDTSSIHMDILSNIRRINTKLTHIAQMIAQCQADWEHPSK